MAISLHLLHLDHNSPDADQVDQQGNSKDGLKPSFRFAKPLFNQADRH